MLQWACARAGAILVTINPAYRVNELVSSTSSLYVVETDSSTFYQIATLKHVGVSTLVVVPQIRTSQYLSMLSTAIPSLTSCRPGEIAVPEIPELRNILVVNDTIATGSGGHPQAIGANFQKIMDEVPCAIDFRELMMWSGGMKEQSAIQDINRGASNVDIVNLQFTRYGSMTAFWNISLIHSVQWNDRPSEGCFCTSHMVRLS